MCKVGFSIFRMKRKYFAVEPKNKNEVIDDESNTFNRNGIKPVCRAGLYYPIILMFILYVRFVSWLFPLLVVYRLRSKAYLSNAIWLRLWQLVSFRSNAGHVEIIEVTFINPFSVFAGISFLNTRGIIWLFWWHSAYTARSRRTKTKMIPYPSLGCWATALAMS